MTASKLLPSVLQNAAIMIVKEFINDVLGVHKSFTRV